MVSILKTQQILKTFAILLGMMILFENQLALAKSKGQDIIIWNGKVILKGGKKKGNIIISNGGHEESYHPQGKYKYKKKYMNYGGFW